MKDVVGTAPAEHNSPGFIQFGLPYQDSVHLLNQSNNPQQQLRDKVEGWGSWTHKTRKFVSF
jgi:hypothetical protein